MTPETPSRSMTLVATGDSIAARRLVIPADPAARALFDLVRGADVAFTNLEIVLSDRIGPPSDQMNLSADAEVAHDLRGLGFDIVGIANNHTWNYGPVGIRRTVAALRHAGLAHAGAGRNLHEARRPAFFETPKGRVALVAAASTFAAGQQATDQRADAPGRPGLNPQRYETTYVVDPPAMEHLRRVAERTGLDKARRRMIERGTASESKRDELSMLGATFREGADFAVTSVPHAGDLAENLRWIRDARRFADLVLVSMHCHEVEGEKGMPPRFLIEFARACIDAGADAFIGHGPHALRGLEIHAGKPIFYSLGNFFYQAEFATQLPGDNYVSREMQQMTMAEFHDHFTDADTKGPPVDRANWESVLPLCTFEDGRLTRLEVLPLTLGFGSPLPRRGSPRLASGALAREILASFRDLSTPFGTALDLRADRAVVALP